MKLKKIVGCLSSVIQRKHGPHRMLVLVTFIIMLSVVFSSHSVQAATSSNPFGYLLVSGNQWLGGRGVNVYWNNGVFSGPSSGYGTEWQCVELAQRLYSQRGWYSGHIFPNTLHAFQIYDNARSLGFVAHANGDGIPVPGDMIVHFGTNAFPDGHVSIVDTVVGNVVNVVEQNASASGKAQYTLSGSTLLPRSGFGTIRGYVHAPANTVATTQLRVAVSVPAIGTDTAHGNNNNPLHSSRILDVQLRNANNALVTDQIIIVSYSNSTGLFSGTLDLGQNFSSGAYAVRITLQHALSHTLGTYTINKGTVISLPSFQVKSGDIYIDNQIDGADYNTMLRCFGSNQCPSDQKAASDLNDNGVVDAIDYNIFIRYYGQKGD